eukprot:6443532-Prymnesium_polylepis.1
MACTVSRVFRIEPAFLSSSSYFESILPRSSAMCCKPKLSTGMQPSTSLSHELSGAGRLWSSRSAPLVRSSAMSASFTEPFFIFCSGPPSVRLTIITTFALGLFTSSTSFQPAADVESAAASPPKPKLHVRLMVWSISALLRNALAAWKVESYRRTVSGPRRHDCLASDASGIVERRVTEGVIDARCQPWSRAARATLRRAGAGPLGRTVVETRAPGSPTGTLHLVSSDRRATRTYDSPSSQPLRSSTVMARSAKAVVAREPIS